jgi:hypothetical protein
MQFLGAVPKNRSDLLPIWSRMVATLDPYMPDMGLGIIAVVSLSQPLVKTIYLTDLISLLPSLA